VLFRSLHIARHARQGLAEYRRDRGVGRLSSPHVDDERPPICPVCGVTMVPGALSARKERSDDWICLECEETGEADAT
jgi:hypothetical protein